MCNSPAVLILPLPQQLKDAILCFWRYLQFSSVQFSHSVMSDSLQTHGLQHARPPCPLPTPGIYSNSCPLSRWCHPTISSSVVPFSSCPQSLAASESYESTLCMRWPKYWSFSFSIILPKNTQDWSPLEWTCWISLQSKWLSRVFSNTTVQKHQFFRAQPSLRFNSQIHTWLDYWKNHSFDYMDLCWQSNVSAF